jgi:tetratricopeptide (TPR) repeat protein
LASVLAVGCGLGQGRVDDAAPLGEQKRSQSAELENVLADVDWANLDEAVAQSVRKAADVVKADLGSSAGWGQMGMLLLAHDLFEPSAQCFAVAAALNATEPRWPYFEGISLRVLDSKASAAKLRRAVELFGPENVWPQLRLGELLIDLEQLDEAEVILNHVLKVDADNAGAHLAVARLHMLRDHPQACLENLRRAGDEEKENPSRKSLLLAAEAYRRLNALDVADKQRELAQSAPERTWSDPIYAQVLALRVGLKSKLDRADQLFLQNDVDGSIRLLEQVITEYPDSEWARILLARGLIRTRRLDEAQSALKDALRVNPNSFEAHFRMAVALQVAGQPERASEWFQKTVTLQPSSAVAYKNLAHCRLALNDIDGAETYLKLAVKVQPNYFDGQLALAEFYVQRGNGESAHHALAAARRLRPDDQRLAAIQRALESGPHIGP